MYYTPRNIELYLLWTNPKFQKQMENKGSWCFPLHTTNGLHLGEKNNEETRIVESVDQGETGVEDLSPR